MISTRGTLLFITGCMYSGKTNYLLDIYLKLKPIFDVSLIKNSFDDDKKGKFVKSRTGLQHPAISTDSLKILSDYPNTDQKRLSFILIDEIQFFKGSEISYIEEGLAKGYNFIVSGLDRDYRGEFFPISELVQNMAETIEILYARCHVCGSPARHTYRNVSQENLYVLDDGSNYQARCDLHK